MANCDIDHIDYSIRGPPSSNAICSPISIVLSTPIFSISLTVKHVVPRSRPTFTPERGTCQPPDPQLHQVGQGGLRHVCRGEPGAGVHDLVHILLLRVHVSVEVDDPDLAAHALRHTASAGIAKIWSWA